MVQMTKSFEHWCFTYHKDIFVQLSFGHLELLTDEFGQEYLDWCQTDEGKQYLEGGTNNV
jgi:hypothetical protein